MPQRKITLRGVEVHNLKSVDLDLNHRQLILFCGVSGSGKTSLALDTLYAEGQRRYIESFSAYTRQYLEQLEKPAAERIEGIPPAIAVTRRSPSRSSRSTVGTATEINDYLRLLFAKISEPRCPQCHRSVHRESPESTAQLLRRLPEKARLMITFCAAQNSGDASRQETSGSTAEEKESVAASNHLVDKLRRDGFQRVLFAGKTLNLNEQPPLSVDSGEPLYVVVDRITGTTSEQRLRDSLETSFHCGKGTCFVFVDSQSAQQAGLEGVADRFDEQAWVRLGFSRDLRCEPCDVDFPDPEPRLFSFNSPLGACPECEGFGNIVDVDMELVVPDPNKSLREGAIAPWNTPAYEHELKELLALAKDYKIPVDVPYHELDKESLRLIREGVPERDFGGLDGFFAWLERRKYKMHLRVYLSRFRSYRLCASCQGNRLHDQALAFCIAGKNIAEICKLRIRDAAAFFDTIDLTRWQSEVGQLMLDQIRSRLGYLEQVGLDYLSLDRSLRTLSGGEAERIALTSALGSSLVNMLYVLDEPSIGLHPRDINRLVRTIEGLRDRGNTVIVVEHEESLIRRADEVVEIGPSAGEHGGEVVFQGTPQQLERTEGSLTGDYLAGRRGICTSSTRRQPDHGWIRLKGARGNNLQNLTVEFPLGLLCLVTGVSGAGKSSLVQDTLYGAICKRMRKEAPKSLPYDDLYGDGQLDDVLLVDQSPIGRSPRSNPVTYIKAFDAIREVFSQQVEARTHNYTPSYFSFNVKGGRCNHCEGDGHIAIDMQFMPDVYMKCPQCHGHRYRKEILRVKYRGRNIAEVLEMTVREAFTFFRGHAKVQSQLKKLIDVGLDYLRLGQPANTLSGGEAQRLKLASYMSASRRGRTLFLLDEPSTGLHFSDVDQLLDCFDSLLAVGHSLIVVEHNLQIMRAADYILDLGPGAAEQGGRIVAQGTPEQIAHQKQSITGKYLAEMLALGTAAKSV